MSEWVVLSIVSARHWRCITSHRAKGAGMPTAVRKKKKNTVTVLMDGVSEDKKCDDHERRATKMGL